MAARALAEKIGQFVQSSWDILEDAYYGRFNLHSNGNSPLSQLARICIASSVAMTVSILFSALSLPFVVPVVLLWCVIATGGRRTARALGFIETCAAGTLVPFVCLWCSCLVVIKVSKRLYRDSVKGTIRLSGRLNRRVRKHFEKLPQHQQQQAHQSNGPLGQVTILPLHDTHHNQPNAHSESANTNISRATTPTTSPPTPPPPPLASPPPPAGREASRKRARFRRSNREAFAFLSLPPELRQHIYGHTFAPYASLICKPSRLLRANPTFTRATALLRTCQQIRHEATPYFYGSTHFHVLTRYPFYRNIHPHHQRHITTLHLVAAANSRGKTGLERALTWDIRRMRSLRRLTISLPQRDVTKSLELVGGALKALKGDANACPHLRQAALLIPAMGGSAANGVRTALRACLEDVASSPAWGGRARCCISVMPGSVSRMGTPAVCVAELVTHRGRYDRNAHAQLLTLGGAGKMVRVAADVVE